MKACSVTILPLGKKALDYFTKRNYNVKADFWEQFSPVDFKKSAAAAEFAMKGQFCTREFVSYNYSANHMSFLFK